MIVMNIADGDTPLLHLPLQTHEFEAVKALLTELAGKPLTITTEDDAILIMPTEPEGPGVPLEPASPAELDERYQRHLQGQAPA